MFLDTAHNINNESVSYNNTRLITVSSESNQIKCEGTSQHFLIS